MPAKKSTKSTTKDNTTTDSAPKRSARKEVAPEPSLAGVGPDDPTYQKLVVMDPATRPDTPEARRDAVLKDQQADLAGKPRPSAKTN